MSVAELLSQCNKRTYSVVKLLFREQLLQRATGVDSSAGTRYGYDYFHLQLYNFTLQPQLLGALQNLRQGITHITEGLVAVVEGDNSPRCNMFQYTFGTLGG